VTFVDLNSISSQLLSRMTQEQADSFDATTHPDAAQENSSGSAHDRTHLNERGKQVFGRLVAENVIRTEVELGPNVVGIPASELLLLQAAPTDGH
jgi:hypothetical protein